MRFTMLQLLRNLRSHSQGKEGKEITDADILNWANNKVKKAGRTSQMEGFKVNNWKMFAFFTSKFCSQLFHLDDITSGFRIRTFQMVSSSSSFLVLWSQGWWIGLLLQKEKLVNLCPLFLEVPSFECGIVSILWDDLKNYLTVNVSNCRGRQEAECNIYY